MSLRSAAAPWLTRYIPPYLQEMGPLDLAWWQWVCLTAVFVLAALLALIATKVVLSDGHQIAKRTTPRGPWRSLPRKVSRTCWVRF